MATTSAPPLHELRFARVASGARIAWARSGRADAPVLVRVAHWMTHVEHDLRSVLWRPWIERLGRAFRLVRYDERGCGLSTADDVPLGLDAALEELAAVVDAHGAARVALLGASGAAPVAIAYAAAHPTRVSHLVLLGGYTHGLLHRSLAPDALAYFDAQLRLVELGWGRGDPAVQEFFTSRFLPDGAPEARAALNEQQRASCGGTRAAAIMRARASLDVRALAPRVRAPTLVLHAEHDRVVPIGLGHQVAASIPGARFETLRTHNHLPIAPEPAFDRLCDAVRDFVHDAAAAPALTAAERRLGALVARGLDNRGIAAHLGLAEKTVRNRLSVLYAKLGVDGRPQAVVRTRDIGL